MKRILSATLITLSCLSLWAQSSNYLSFTDAFMSTREGVNREITDQGINGITVHYTIPGGTVSQTMVGGTAYQTISIKDFPYLKEVGKPALPVHYDLVMIPKGATIQLSWESGSQQSYTDYRIYPALQPATDREGDPEPQFEIDEAFYASNTIYPTEAVSIIKKMIIRGMEVALIQICPVQYNPAQGRITLLSDISYTVQFTGANDFFGNSEWSAAFMERLPNLVVNNKGVKAAADSYLDARKGITGPSVNYIIITHSNYLAAADSLARWKAQLGYTSEIVSSSSWTSATVKSAIQQRYQNWNPKPDYFVIIGDHDLVPGEIHQDPSYGDDFATDLYYACMDGGSDYVADMAFGRISVSSASEAMSVVQKIINYERNPPAVPGFYSTALNCAMFQDDDSNDYEDRRFSLTNEDIRTYMVNQQGFTINRVYKTDNSITPLYWNNGTYAAGEPVPSNLRKPTFAWDGDKYDIRDEINSATGRLFVMHRDHGYVGGTGWATPQFVTSDISMLNNGNRLPIIFSINCHTGEYQLPECFCERFLRYPNGGAAGVFGAAYYSYSGYNDGLAIGMIDAIWANPGLIPNFTGNGDSPSGSPSAHAPIYTMGDVMNQGLIRMVQTWGDNVYTHQLFHYFGDPAMQIWTGVPVAVTATHTDSLFCNDTIFQVYSSSLADGLATLVVDGQLIAATTLSSGTGTFHFAPFGGTEAILTISKHNYQPYVAYIPVDPDCVSASFETDPDGLCVGSDIDFTSTSTGTILTYSWDFGTDAVPATASTAGPHTVHYTSPGIKTITLTVTGASGSNSTSQQLAINQVCEYVMSQNDYTAIEGCNGILFDNGWTNNYAVNSNDTVTVTATGASSIQLLFHDFDVEAGSGSLCDYDLLSIYDGPTTASALLGSWCNTGGHTPPATLNTSSSSFTVVFHSDGGVQLRGFELEWACTSPNSPPNVNYSATPLMTCTGEISFTDHSLNSPTSWLWDFGDGNTSTLQNPSHTYTQSGLYTVSLTATNTYGSDTYTNIEYISVTRPEGPLADTGLICISGTADLHAIGSGDLYWYDQPTGGVSLASGTTFTTPVLSADAIYYVEDQIQDVHYTSPTDNSIGIGAYYTGASSHYLIFDALSDFTLVSVKVYSQLAQNRTIELRNSSNTVLYDTTVNIGVGEQRVTLNFPVSTGSSYRLACSATSQLYRNSSGASFPYTIPGVVSITGTSYTDPAYYYYYYDWEILGSECTSERTSVPVFVHTQPPVADFGYTIYLDTYDFTDMSTGADTWSWDFDDGSGSALQNPSHTYTANGTYIISLTATNGCGTDISSDTIYLISVLTEEAQQGLNLRIFPNPTTGSVFVAVPSQVSGDIIFRVYDPTGRLVVSKSMQNHTDGLYTLDLKNLNQGIFLLEVLSDNYTWKSRIIRTQH